MEVRCEHCGKRLRVIDSLTGQRRRCPFCKRRIEIPYDVDAVIRFERKLNKVDEGELKHYLVFAVTLAALASILVEVGWFALIGIVSLNGDHSSSGPWTFHIVWEVGFLVLIFATANKFLLLDPKFLLTAAVIGGIISTIIWSLVMPDSLKLEPRYIGVMSGIEDLPESKFRHLYDADTLKLEDEIDRDAGEVLYGTRPFTFWQTGVAAGYNPQGLQEYRGKEGFWGFLELVFTAGPLTIVEMTMRALIFDFPIFLVLAVIYCISAHFHFSTIERSFLRPEI